MSAPSDTAMTRSLRETVEIHAPPEAVFAHVDDLRNVGWHMRERAMALMGSRLDLEQLSDNATGIGARYRWHGRIAGLTVDLTEVVTEWVPNRRKTWETIGNPRIVLMSHYRMRLTVSPLDHGTLLAFDIQYDPPRSFWGRMLGWLLADWYSRWCFRRMCRDAKKALEAH